MMTLIFSQIVWMCPLAIWPWKLGTLTNMLLRNNKICAGPCRVPGGVYTIFQHNGLKSNPTCDFTPPPPKVASSCRDRC